MAVVIDGMDYLSAAAAAEQLATTEMKILMLLRQKALSGLLVGGSWFVTKASVDGYDTTVCRQEEQPQCRTSRSGSGCGCH